MFKDYANQWTAVAPSESLKANKSIGLKIAGERVVLFRDAKGNAKALIDICPHRGVALSLGKVKDGCITCPFHGWRFDGEGACVKVPWNPDAKREVLNAKALPVTEQAGVVWLYTALGSVAPGTPPVPDEMLTPRIRTSGFTVDWKTHWTRAMENMLDFPHLPFVHTGTIGKAWRKPAEVRRMDLPFEERPWGATTLTKFDGKDEPGRLDYRFPNMMVLHIPMPLFSLKLMIACVPIDDENTRMVIMSMRNFLKPRLFDWIFRRMNRRVASEDKPILETSWPVEVPEPRLERSVRTDQPTLYFRRIYQSRIKDQDFNQQESQL
jgi:phenylpropionate dioxygenase-like ring-hydroxylating dioxygenase large terminal subunit